jgi:hypothetical protein
VEERNEDKLTLIGENEVLGDFALGDRRIKYC